MPSFDANLMNDDTDWTIELDIAVITQALLSNPAFIKAVANEIRIAQTKQARTMGNLYGPNAQRPKPAPTTKRRIS